jgi:tetratricopeptide (TPR) repeat protein
MSDRPIQEFQADGNGRFAVGRVLPWVWRAGGLLALAALLTALYWTIRVAWSDWAFREWNPQSIRRAIRLAPGSPNYYRGWAEIEPAVAVAALEKAATLNPVNSDIRIELSTAAEAKQDYRNAEASLLKAVELDKTFAPRWTLADYHFRRREVEKFWPAVKAALATSYGDVSFLFQNCWTLSPDPQTILEKAIPDRQDVLRRYLDYLLAGSRIEEADPVARKVLAQASKESAGALLNYCDRLLEMGRGQQALVVWNGLSERKLMPYSTLSPEAGNVLTNGDFGMPGMGTGFDWRVLSPGGIYIDRAGKPPALHISFSGKQAENCDILSQYVPLLPGREYVLSVRYRVAGIGAESGLICRLLAQPNGADLLNDSGLLPGGAEDETERVFQVTTPGRTTLARLVFGYRRITGTMRIEGSVSLRRFALSLAPESGR